MAAICSRDRTLGERRVIGMVDTSDLETRLRRLEASHEALTHRVEVLNSTEGAIRMHFMVKEFKGKILLAVLVILGLLSVFIYLVYGKY